MPVMQRSPGRDAGIGQEVASPDRPAYEPCV
jgi:hypothetical protein